MLPGSTKASVTATFELPLDDAIFVQLAELGLDSDDEGVLYSIEMTDLRKNNDYVRFYSLITSGIVMVIVPFGALITAYVAIFR